MQHNEAHLPQIGEGLNKKEIHTLAQKSVDGVLETGNVFAVAEALAAMEEFTRLVRKDERYIDFLREELSKHNGRLFTASGARIELCEAGVSYDYSSSAEWNALEDEIRRLQERKKAVEERLRRIGAGRMHVDPETGEITEGVYKSSRSTYRITLSR